MQIFTADENILKLLVVFVQPYEHTCVTLTSKIKKSPKDVFVLTQDENIKTITTADQIWGFFYLDKTFLHCFPKLSQTENINIVKLCIKDFIQDKEIKCINGEKTATDFLLSILSELGKDPAQINSYELMVLEQTAFPPPEQLSCDDEIKRCHEIDYDLLFDLQKKYLLKEVAPVNRQLSDLQCAASLKQLLKNQLCFALYSDGEVVSKANTNAIGINWIQIGGVYTHPLYRHNYYAWHLVYKICERIQKAGHKAVLFVKERNIPALKLYQRMGFTHNTFFEIAYFD